MVEKIVLIQPSDPEGTIVIRDHMGKFGIKEKKTSIIREDIFPSARALSNNFRFYRLKDITNLAHECINLEERS